tara:strand:- start:1082 stop:1318 length:237 start_codon:yes stop_codon:yes gene_type:complete
MTDEPTLTENGDGKVRWTNRRRMAWLALSSIIVVTGLAFFVLPIDRLDKLADVITWFYLSMASIVGAYMGLSTWAAKK